MAKSSRESRILAALFFGPPLLVALAVFGPLDVSWLPQPEQPYGERYETPLPLPEISLTTTEGRVSPDEWARTQWSLIYATLGVCDERCARLLESIQRVELAMSDDAESVRRVFLHGAQLEDLDRMAVLTEGVTVARLDEPEAAALREALGEDLIADAGTIYIADPLGRLVMRYGPEPESDGILRDLRRLVAIARMV